MPASHPSSKTPNRRIAASDLDARQLRAFVAVVREGSVSRAAATLGLAQSTVSEALAALDRTLGVAALQRQRGARRMPLTAAGRALLPHAERALEEISAAQLAVAVATRKARGHIELVANESVSTYFLTPALNTLRRSWPRTTFAVTIGTCDAVRGRVDSASCDLGLLLEEDRARRATTSPGRAAARQEVRRGLPLSIFADPRHRLCRNSGRAIRRDSLTPYPVFVSDSAGDMQDLLFRYFTAEGLAAPRLDAAGTIEGVRRGVAGDSKALGILPQYALAEDLRSGRVRTLRVEPAPPQLRLVALLPPTNTSRHPAIAALIALLRP